MKLSSKNLVALKLKITTYGQIKGKAKDEKNLMKEFEAKGLQTHQKVKIFFFSELFCSDQSWETSDREIKWKYTGMR